MMGLLDDITDSLSGANLDQQGKAALKQGLLTMGLNLMANKGSLASSIGRSGLAGVDAYQGSIADQRKKSAQDQQMEAQRLAIEQARTTNPMHAQALQLQLDESKRAAEQAAQQQSWLRNLPSPQFSAGQAAMAGGGGPTAANAGRVAPVDPTQQLTFDAVKNGALPFSSYLATQQKDRTPLTVKADETLVDRNTMKPLFTGAPKASETPLSYREWQLAGGPASGRTYPQWVKDKTPNTSVNVSMDKGFGDTFAKDAASSLAASRDKARGAAQSLQALDRVDEAVKGGALVGPGSDWASVALRVGSALGVMGKTTDEKLQKTADLIQGQAQLAVGGAQMLAGQGQITDRERDLINRAAGGDLQKFSSPEISQLTGVLRKINQQTITQHNGMLDNVQPQFQQFTPFYRVPSPGGQAAPGVAPAAPKPVAQPAAASWRPIQIMGESDYQRLPSGTRYQAPDGSIRTKS